MKLREVGEANAGGRIFRGAIDKAGNGAVMDEMIMKRRWRTSGGFGSKEGT